MSASTPGPCRAAETISQRIVRDKARAILRDMGETA